MLDEVGPEAQRLAPKSKRAIAAFDSPKGRHRSFAGVAQAVPVPLEAYVLSFCGAFRLAPHECERDDWRHSTKTASGTRRPLPHAAARGL